jgi:acyl-lipid omega-6 desaturase (Delta-12 desaturase)
LGYIAGIITFTPFEDWRHTHWRHHVTVGDLDRRGEDPIWLLTVDEFWAATKQTRFINSLYRNPFFLFCLAPIILFLIVQRFPITGTVKLERYSVALSNPALFLVLLAANFTMGLQTYFMIQLPIIFIGSSAGVWLFYMQHQFAGVSWARHGDWDPMKAALSGSSYYKLPKVLQWATGSIGLHHVRHVRLLVPNYNLQQALNEFPALQVG